MNNSAAPIRNSVVAALGGFLFGFDTAVISGVEQSIQTLWSLDSFSHGFTVAAALIGTVLGSLMAGWPAERFGRKKVLLAIGIIYVITSLVTALTASWVPFVIFRFLGGIGVGASSVVGPMYISEISPAHSRGRLVALFQFNIVCGILIAFISNYLLNGVSEESWRWMLGVQAVPSVIFFVLALFIPESPRWLMKQGLEAEAKVVLNGIGEKEPEMALQEIRTSLRHEAGEENLFSGKYAKPIMYAVGLAVFNQFSGINAIMYYAPRIFAMTGLSQDSALLQAISIGVTNLVFTMLAILVIDRYGRRTLLIAGSVGMTFCLALVAQAFYTGNFGGYFVMLCLVGFIAFFAFSQGAVIWVFLAEIFPNKVRAKGQTLGSSTHWVMAAAISWTFPVFASQSAMGGAYAFTFFAVMMFMQLFFAWKVLPETKGLSLEEIQKSLGIH
ncbi:MAG: sugar porter family MFS transporter [Cyclobacteriaceae bacterium]|nr:sugar porter family MFS transporter [Cyclobacteriaceae bacterium]